MNHCAEHTKPDLKGAQAESIDILEAVRRRLANRLSVAVVLNKQQLLGRATLLNSPLTCDRELAEIAAGLCQVDQVLAAMRIGSRETQDAEVGRSSGSDLSDNGFSRTFSEYARLVGENRLEEASRELSRVLEMPLDRVGTATHFFARAALNNPSLLSGLAVLHEQVATGPIAEGTRLLMRTFGFQAVESRVALGTLQARGQDQARKHP